MLNAIAGCDARIVKVQGSARGGKTEALVRRVARLLENGVDPTQVLVAVPTGFAAQAFRERLAAGVRPELSAAAAAVTVGRPLEICCTVLDEPAARAASGRVPRILNDAEQAIFLEDMKTLGMKSSRLRNMLMFFYAQWSAFEDEEEWLIPGEETDVLAYARRILTATGAVLRHEAPYLCGKLLSSETGRPLGARFSHVLADDYQDFSRAEQVCLGLLAREQLVVCGDASRATAANTDYPNPEGFAKFERLHRNVAVFDLGEGHGIAGALAFEKALAAAATAGEDSPSLLNPGERPVAGDRGSAWAPMPCDASEAADGAVFLRWETPEEELAGITRAVRAYLASDPGRRPCDVTVAVPTRRWGDLVRRALRAEGLASSGAGLGPRLGGDPRAAGHHGALTAYVALCLVADPRDMVAWRLWTGFDNAITNSEAWEALYGRWSTGDRPLYDVLARTVADTSEADPVLKVAVLRRAWDAGQALIERCQPLRGLDLADALGLLGEPVFEEALACVCPGEGARELLARVRRHLASPVWPDDPERVRVALYENLGGTQSPLLLMPGMVDGLLPAREVFEIDRTDKRRRKVLCDDRARLRRCIVTGADLVVGSAFVQADLEVAEESRMRVERVASVEGRRQCVVAPSLYFEEAAGAFGGFTAADAVDMGALFAKRP